MNSTQFSLLNWAIKIFAYLTGGFRPKKRLESQHFYVQSGWTCVCPVQFECRFRRCYWKYCICRPLVSREITICRMTHCVNISISIYCLEERNIFTAKILHQTSSMWLRVRRVCSTLLKKDLVFSFQNSHFTGPHIAYLLCKYKFISCWILQCISNILYFSGYFPFVSKV